MLAAAADDRRAGCLRRLLRLGGPVTLQAALSFSSSLVSLAFAGHLGAAALGQAVLALSLYNITAASVTVGLAQGLETLCSQARPTPATRGRGARPRGGPPAVCLLALGDLVERAGTRDPLRGRSPAVL
jgi:hypothetical protein